VEKRPTGLEEEVVRHIFLDLATTLVGIAIGFSVVFATEMGLTGILTFVWIAGVTLFVWWRYLGIRLKYVPLLKPGQHALPFPVLDAILLIIISLIPSVSYGMAKEELHWPLYSTLILVGLLFLVWGIWWYHILRTFPKEVAEYGEERLLKVHGRVFFETSFICFLGAGANVMFGPSLPLYFGAIALGMIWIPLRFHVFYRL